VNKHGKQLFEANMEPGGNESWDYLPYGPFDNEQCYHQWLKTIQSETDPCFFAIIRVSDQRAVGVASYLRINPEDGTIEVGHINFSPTLQRTTEATEAMFLMMRWAFEAGYRRYEWKCNALNLKSRKAAQRLGLSYEGVFRQATMSKGRNRDTAWFAAIDKEWPSLKVRFEQYLSSKNFTNEGGPRVSLTELNKPYLYKEDNHEFS
jgi:RimJ/RimL family protein N-acetyltransferase